MEMLSTIQKRNKLNDVCRMGEEGPGGAHHTYAIYMTGTKVNTTEDFCHLIEFQKGPRNDENSRHGVLDEDLLETE